MTDRELTKAEIEQIDHVHNVAYNAMCELLGEDVLWDMEWIGELADCMVSLAWEYFSLTEEELYPYLERENK